MKIKEKFENIILDNNDLIPAVNQCMEVTKKTTIDFANKLLEMPNRFLEAKTIEEHFEDFISNETES